MKTTVDTDYQLCFCKKKKKILDPSISTPPIYKFLGCGHFHLRPNVLTTLVVALQGPMTRLLLKANVVQPKLHLSTEYIDYGAVQVSHCKVIYHNMSESGHTILP